MKHHIGLRKNAFFLSSARKIIYTVSTPGSFSQKVFFQFQNFSGAADCLVGAPQTKVSLAAKRGVMTWGDGQVEAQLKM